MPIYKRKRLEADNFAAQNDDPNDPAIALDRELSMGFYKKEDISIAAAINNVDRFYLRNNCLVLSTLSTVDSSQNNSIFISGATLQFRDNAGNIRRLDA